MEHPAKSETRLDGDRRIGRLTAPLSGSGGMACLHGFLGEPHGMRLPRRTSAASYFG